MLRHIARAAALACVAAPLFTASAEAKQIVEVAFVLDTTGSMGPLIEGAKRKIWSIATSIVDCTPDAEIRMGLVAYRDVGDEYVTTRFDLTTDIQELYGKLLALRAQGGGDWPESVNEALEVAVKKLSWTQDDGVQRIMFLVGDAPPHMDYAQDTKYPEVVRMARERGIIVNAVQAGEAQDTARVWRSIAQMGHGEYIPIPQDGGHLVVIETPYDTHIIELQRKINGTVVPYGSHRRRSEVEDKTRQSTAAPAPMASDMASYMSKHSAGAVVAAAVTGDGDLVADAAEGRVKLDAVQEDELPDNVKAMKPAERRAYLDTQAASRKVLNGELSALVQKRDAYVAVENAKRPDGAKDSFDRAVSATIAKQLVK